MKNVKRYFNVKISMHGSENNFCGSLNTLPLKNIKYMGNTWISLKVVGSFLYSSQSRPPA